MVCYNYLFLERMDISLSVLVQVLVKVLMVVALVIMVEVVVVATDCQLASSEIVSHSCNIDNSFWKHWRPSSSGPRQRREKSTGEL